MNQKSFKKVALRFKQLTRKGYGAFNSLHRVVNIGVVAACVLTYANVTATSAQSNVQSHRSVETLTEELEEVMVTASRVEMPLAQTPKLVTVINKEQINRAPVRSVQDLLNYTANVDILQRSGHGVQADVSIRGGSFNQTAILLNGINLSNAQTGHYSFDFPLNLSDIERIEIVQGPSALIYGAGAFSGGINIITKKNTNEKLYAKVESGMHDLKGIEVRGSARTGIASHTLSVSNNSSDGYAHNTDYAIHNMLWQTRLSLRESSTLDVQLGYNEKNYGANSFYTAAFPDQYERTSSYIATVKGEFDITPSLKFIPIAYWNRHYDQFDLVKDTDFGRNHHRGDMYGTNLILQYTSRLGITSLGSEVRKEDILSSNLGKVMAAPRGNYSSYDDRTNVSGTAEHTVSINRITLSAGALMNYNTFIGNGAEFFPSAGASYRANDYITFASSWSKSMRVPSFTELYYNTDTHVANENLLPEKSESADLSLRCRNSIFDASVTGFLLWGRNMIDWIKETPDAKPASANITEVDTKGIETNARLRIGRLVPALGHDASIALGYTRMWQDINSGMYISESADKLNYLRDKFTAQLNHRIIDKLSISWFLRTQKRMGQYTIFNDNKSTGVSSGYPGFSTLDLKLQYACSNNLVFNLNINNIFDTDYVDLGNIHQPGLWLMGGISYTIN